MAQSDRYNGNGKRKIDRNEEPEDMDYSFQKLKGFHIPRKKSKDDHELLIPMATSGRQFTRNILPAIRASLFDPQNFKRMNFVTAEQVQNPEFENEYVNKKRILKDEGRLDKDSETYGYLYVRTHREAEDISQYGLRMNHTNTVTLGRPEMGVYVCKHPDLIRNAPFEDGAEGYLMMFKIIKGKVKVVPECRTKSTTQEPTPLYDCHTAKLPNDINSSHHSRLHSILQYYMYEYGDVDLVCRPRHVLPFVVLKFKYIANQNNQGRNTRLSTIEENSDTSASYMNLINPVNKFHHWYGKLLVNRTDFGPVQLRAQDDITTNVAILKNSISVSSYLPVDVATRQFPPTLQSKSGKKYNVIYRGKYYNTFTLHPSPYCNKEKFTSLLSLLVDQSATAVAYLPCQSVVYLLPISATTESMGLQPSYDAIMHQARATNQNPSDLKLFLYAIFVTPRIISTKIYDKKIANLIRPQKRKDSDHNSPYFEIEHKLHTLNVDSTQALDGMSVDEIDKLKNCLNDKKKNQVQAEKMLHHYYREPSSHITTSSTFKFNLMSKWRNNENLQNEYYIQRSNKKLYNSETRKKSNSESSPLDGAEDYHDIEATFSDDDDDPMSSNAQKKPDPIQLKQMSKEESPGPVISNIPTDDPVAKVATPSPCIERVREPSLSPAVVPPSYKSPTPQEQFSYSSYEPSPSNRTISRPTFQPLDELIISQAVEELYKHPEFMFSDDYMNSHDVITEHTSIKPWSEPHSQLSVTLYQDTPYMTSQYDCPFSCDDDNGVAKSMLRAIHGRYNHEDSSTSDDEKVVWVREVLHKVSSDDEADAVQDDKLERKIVEENDVITIEDDSPSSAQGHSTDSGIALTPGGEDEQASLKRIAKIIANALSSPDEQAKLLSTATASFDNSGLEKAAQDLMSVIADDKAPQPPVYSSQLSSGEIPATPANLEDGVDMELCSDNENENQSNIELGGGPNQSNQENIPQGNLQVKKMSSQFLRSVSPTNIEKAMRSLKVKQKVDMETIRKILRKVNVMKPSTKLQNSTQMNTNPSPRRPGQHGRTVYTTGPLTDRRKLTIVIGKKPQDPTLKKGCEHQKDTILKMESIIKKDTTNEIKPLFTKESLKELKITTTTDRSIVSTAPLPIIDLTQVSSPTRTKPIVHDQPAQTTKNTIEDELKPLTSAIPDIANILPTVGDKSKLNLNKDNILESISKLFSSKTNEVDKKDCNTVLPLSMQKSPKDSGQPKPKRIKLDRKQPISSKAKLEADLMRKELNKNIVVLSSKPERHKSIDSTKSKEPVKAKPKDARKTNDPLKTQEPAPTKAVDDTVVKVVGEIEAQLSSIKEGGIKKTNIKDSIAKLLDLAESLQKENPENKPPPAAPKRLFRDITMPPGAREKDSDRFDRMLSIVDIKLKKFDKMNDKPVTSDKIELDLTLPSNIKRIISRSLDEYDSICNHQDPPQSIEVLKSINPNINRNKESPPRRTNQNMVVSTQAENTRSNRKPPPSPIEFSDNESPQKSSTASSMKDDNLFFVYNPHNSETCKKMSKYLLEVNGSLFDITEFANNFRKEIALTPRFNANMVNRILPNGNFWIILRIQDINMLSSIPHLSLLKTLGSRVQFVVCGNVSDVKKGIGQNILQGDGGILVPMSLDALLGKQDSIKNLLAWLISHSTLPGNRWKIVIHKHIKAALSVARGSHDQKTRIAAKLLHELIRECSSEQIELSVHDCDDLHLRPSPTRQCEELTEATCICAMKLQLEFVRKYRHVIMLADPNDTAVDTWGTLWRCGVCTTTIDDFSNFVSKKLKSSKNSNSDLSSVLSLYSQGLQYL